MSFAALILKTLFSPPHLALLRLFLPPLLQGSLSTEGKDLMEKFYLVLQVLGFLFV